MSVMSLAIAGAALTQQRDFPNSAENTNSYYASARNNFHASVIDIGLKPDGNTSTLFASPLKILFGVRSLWLGDKLKLHLLY